MLMYVNVNDRFKERDMQGRRGRAPDVAVALLIFLTCAYERSYLVGATRSRPEDSCLWIAGAEVCS